MFTIHLMKYKTRQSSLKGVIVIPPSKSQTMRAILLGSLSSDITYIRNYLISPDTQVMIDTCRGWGADITPDGLNLKIQGRIIHDFNPLKIINVGNSGLVLRFCSTIAAFSKEKTLVTGDRSIKTNRPMGAVISGLTQLGVKVKSLETKGFAPIDITGPIIPNEITIDGLDSQPVSSFIIASCFAQRAITINVKKPEEKPWIALTLSWLDFLKLSYYANEEFTQFIIPGNQKHKGFEYSIPGDLSSLSFPLAGAIITHSELTIKNIDLTDLQQDKKIIDVFRLMGAIIHYDEKKRTLTILPCTSLKGVIVDINDLIDTISILAVVACFAETPTHIKNAANARNKECDRIHATAVELKKMNADIEETEDGLIINPSQLQGTFVNSHGDHRLAMALTIAGLGTYKETEINNVECINKSFPNFFESVIKIGANIEQSF
ncbi:MAG: 3-phosphoshikimate 1-carboxyvinyltransferase [Victivallaceae bacterium]